MKLLILSSLVLLLSGAAFGKDCSFQASQKDFEVSWTAFKTPAKAGVNGKFTKLGLEKDLYSANEIPALLEGAKFSIPVSSVSTKDTGRDAKIVQFFFGGVKNIKGAVLEADNNSLTLGLEMNGVKKEVPLKASLSEGTLKAEGVIDVLDFSMSSGLKALNKACYELHEGKTWSDVNIMLMVKTKKVCK